MASLIVPAYHACLIVKDQSSLFARSMGIFKEAPQAPRLHQDESLNAFFTREQIDPKGIMFYDSTSEKVDTISAQRGRMSAIFVNSKIHKHVPNALNCLIKREAYFINSDARNQEHRIRVITSLAIAIITTIFFNFFASLGMTLLADQLVHIVYNQYHERSADQFAVKNATDLELLEMTTYLKALKGLNQHNKNLDTWRSRFIIAGENWLDLATPGIGSKLSKVTSELKKRKVSDALHDTKKMSPEQKEVYEAQVNSLARDLFTHQHQTYGYYLDQLNTPPVVKALINPQVPPVLPSAPEAASHQPT